MARTNASSVLKTMITRASMSMTVIAGSVIMTSHSLMTNSIRAGSWRITERGCYGRELDLGLTLLAGSAARGTVPCRKRRTAVTDSSPEVGRYERSQPFDQLGGASRVVRVGNEIVVLDVGR